MMKWAMCFAGFALLSAGLVNADDRLLMRVSPSFAFAPANLVVRTTIAADPENRAIEIVAESDEFYRSSEMQLDGESAPRTTTFEFRSLPTGAYSVRAVLKGQGGDALVMVEHTVNIVDGNEDRR